MQKKKPTSRHISEPLISVMMCAYNAEAHIQEAIHSVLGQDYGDFEFIIVDDGSTDSTLGIISQIKDSRIRIISCKHDYIHSVNTGLKACKGMFIARTDADDLMMPNRLATQLQVMQRNPEIAACFSWGTTFGSVEESIGHCVRGMVDQAFFWLLTGNYLMHPSAMFRADFIKKNKLRYKRYMFAEDYKLWTDMTRIGGQIFVIPEPLFKYRISPSQISQVYHAEQNKTRLKIQQEVLEELLHRLQDPHKTQLVRYYNMMLKLNQASLLQGYEVIIMMYKILRRTTFFVH